MNANAHHSTCLADGIIVPMQIESKRRINVPYCTILGQLSSEKRLLVDLSLILGGDYRVFTSGMSDQAVVDFGDK